LFSARRSPRRTAKQALTMQKGLFGKDKKVKDEELNFNPTNQK
jgi:hypothetical protein